MKDYRYLILTHGQLGPDTSKTANSVIRYLPERVVGVLDGVHAGRAVGEVLGFGGEIPVVGTLGEGLALGATALLIGTAPSGGQLPDDWRPVIRAGMDAGLDVVSGLHALLSADRELSEHAAAAGVRIRDLRLPPPGLSISTGRARLVKPLVVHTMGTDCNIGKMTAALQLRTGLQEGGARVGFAATGQTGILIEGRGIAVDAVIADFIAGAAEMVVLEAAEGNDVVLVEGQGSLVHPAYSGVTLGLLHGSLPDVMILCHKPTRRTAYGSNGAYSWMPLPPLAEMVRICEAAIAPLRPARVIGVALNTSDLEEGEALDAIERAAAETGLPVTDPVRFDPGPLVTVVLREAEDKRQRRAARGLNQRAARSGPLPAPQPHA